jgi:integrase
MPVRARGSMFQVDITWKGSRIRQGGFDSQARAEQWEERAMEKLRQGTAATAVQAAAATEVATMKQLYDRTYTKLWQGSKGEGTAVINAVSVLAVLGESTDPNSLRESDIDHLIKTFRDQGLGNGTINRKLSALSTMLRFAKNRGWVQQVPHIPRQKEKRHRIRWLSPEEEVRVLELCAGWPEMEDLVAFLLDTGMRISEALRLTWSDFDKDDSRTWARIWDSKNGQPRSVPLTARAKTLVERRQQESQFSDPPVATLFTMTRHQADKKWAMIREEMGLEQDKEFVIHALRHTCASRLIQDGVDLPSIQQYLGHKDYQTTLRYGHLAPRNLVNAVVSLEKIHPVQARPPLRLANTG